MRTFHHNGEFWYVDVKPMWTRVARWLVWCGGWEALGLIRRGRISQPWPLSLLGHRVTFHGRWVDIRLGRSWLVIGWQRGKLRDGNSCWHAYISRDATPSSAHCWLHGAPPDVAQAAKKRLQRSKDGYPLPPFAG